MKRFVVFVVMALFVLAAGGMVYAAHHEASVEKGKALFNDAKLGTTGKSCNDCHKDGKGVEKAGSMKDMESMVNKCITQALQGKALDAKSIEMQSMVLYIKSLSKKKAPIGC